MSTHLVPDDLVRDLSDILEFRGRPGHEGVPGLVVVELVTVGSSIRRWMFRHVESGQPTKPLDTRPEKP